MKYKVFNNLESLKNLVQPAGLGEHTVEGGPHAKNESAYIYLTFLTLFCSPRLFFLKIRQIRQFFADAKEAGILIHCCFLVGNPGETKETLQKTLEFAKVLNPDTAQFFPIMVYPGTEAY